MPPPLLLPRKAHAPGWLRRRSVGPKWRWQRPPLPAHVGHAPAAAALQQEGGGCGLTQVCSVHNIHLPRQQLVQPTRLPQMLAWLSLLLLLASTGRCCKHKGRRRGVGLPMPPAAARAAERRRSRRGCGGRCSGAPSDLLSRLQRLQAGGCCHGRRCAGQTLLSNRGHHWLCGRSGMR